LYEWAAALVIVEEMEGIQQTTVSLTFQEDIQHYGCTAVQLDFSSVPSIRGDAYALVCTEQRICPR
jgi:hypothetical protein